MASLLFLFAACAAPVDDPNAPYPAPDFTITTLDGDTFRLSDQRGGWTLINFWATWCAPCVEEMPALDRIADDPARRLTVIGVNVREARDLVQPFIQQLGVSFPIGIDPPDSVLLDYQVIGLPQTVVVNPDGLVVWRQFGPLDEAGFASLLRSFGISGD